MPKKGSNTAKQCKIQISKLCRLYIFPGGGQKLTHCRPQTDIERKEKKKFGGILGHSPGMPPSFPSENPPEGGGDAALFACAKAGSQGREDERHWMEKGIRKITFREVPGRGIRGKAGAVKSLPGGFFRCAWRENPEKSPFKAENHRQSTQANVHKMNTIYKSQGKTQIILDFEND